MGEEFPIQKEKRKKFMTRKTTTARKPTDHAQNDDLTESSTDVNNHGCPLLCIAAEDGRVFGFITDRGIGNTPATKNINFELNTVASVTHGRIIPCRSDEQLRTALKVLLGPPEIQVTVAGGLVRHGSR